MEYTRLGRTGLQVSRLCLGTMNFGPETTEDDSRAIMDGALERGLNFLDTANSYGRKLGEGITESIVGRWLETGGNRDRVVLATKVYSRMGERPNEGRLSAYHIRKACEASLKRLRTDRIDLYQMHHVDRDTPWDEVWQAMEWLVAQGMVLYVGTSNFAGWQIATGQAEAERRNLLGLVSEQSFYNLNARSIELEVIPACRHHGLALIPWSPLGRGLLGGVLDKAREGRRASQSMVETIEKHRRQLEDYEGLCAELGERPADVALAWLLANPAVTAPIVGPRTMEQLDTSLRALELRLDGDTLARLDQIWPGPGGEAPEAYAW